MHIELVTISDPLRIKCHPPSNLPFLVSLPPFPNYRVTVAAAPPERRERAGTRRPCRRHVKGARRARRLRCPRRPRRRRAAGARGAPRSRVAAAPSELRDRAVCAVYKDPVPSEFSPSPAPVQCRDPGRDAANNCYYITVIPLLTAPYIVPSLSADRPLFRRDCK